MYAVFRFRMSVCVRLCVSAAKKAKVDQYSFSQSPQRFKRLFLPFFAFSACFARDISGDQQEYPICGR